MSNLHPHIVDLTSAFADIRRILDSKLPINSLRPNFVRCAEYYDKINTLTLASQVKALTEILWEYQPRGFAQILCHAMEVSLKKDTPQETFEKLIQNATMVKTFIVLGSIAAIRADHQPRNILENMRNIARDIVVKLPGVLESTRRFSDLGDTVAVSILGRDWYTMKDIYGIESDDPWKMPDILAKIPDSAFVTANANTSPAPDLPDGLIL